MPPPPTKRIKRPPKVLDEDTYTDALSRIIARDFFPGLVETKTQQEYLDALESQDEEWIASARKRLTQVMTPGSRRRTRRGTSLAGLEAGSTAGDTPRGYGGDTPMSVVSGVSTDTTRSTQMPEVDLDLSLDAFQAKYTSEDNESFNKLLDKQNNKRAQKYAWLWAGNKIPAARQIKQREREGELLEAKLAQETVDGGKELILIEGPDKRKAMPDSWRSRPDNQVFFAPEGVEDEVETVHQKAEANSKAPSRGVVYDNTRLPPATVSDAPIPASPSLSAIQDAIAGRPRASASEPGYPSGSQTPRVNGYAYVDVDDPPSPSQPLLSTLTQQGNSTPNPFKIKEQSKRESLHHRMVDRVAKINRLAAGGRRQGSSVTPSPVPRFASSPRTTPGGLTPAAQRLWGKVGSPAGSVGGMSVFERGRMTVGGKERRESGLKIRWTPTPRSRSRSRSKAEND